MTHDNRLFLLSLSLSAGPLWFHPLTNEASTSISSSDLLALLGHTGHAHTVVDFAA